MRCCAGVDAILYKKRSGRIGVIEEQQLCWCARPTHGEMLVGPRPIFSPNCVAFQNGGGLVAAVVLRLGHDCAATAIRINGCVYHHS